ncbi:unnamed protein product [Ceutorhynchus assimilis]|uniref:Uncharacterized protein n=1 Tax=Ceutorhynchus assimilis TaxID=467358 RepID=A0A9P0DKL5_9CUCU|nr:unnamed protein product [Ceutorhynchus assimilis]
MRFIIGSLFLLCIIISMTNAGNSKNTAKLEDSNNISDEKPKKFIGRIERGKVLVLKNNKAINSDDESEEKVCQKYDKNNCNDNSSSEEQKHKQKIKYSIKFKHEKQQKHKNNNEEMRIIKLHKNELKQYGKEDLDEDSDEDERPFIKKRLRFDEDD